MTKYGPNQGNQKVTSEPSVPEMHVSTTLCIKKTRKKGGVGQKIAGFPLAALHPVRFRQTRAKDASQLSPRLVGVGAGHQGQAPGDHARLLQVRDDPGQRASPPTPQT